MRPIKVLAKIYYLFDCLCPRPEVGANSRLAKVRFLKSGSAMGSATPDICLYASKKTDYIYPRSLCQSRMCATMVNQSGMGATYVDV